MGVLHLSAIRIFRCQLQATLVPVLRLRALDRVRLSSSASAAEVGPLVGQVMRSDLKCLTKTTGFSTVTVRHGMPKQLTGLSFGDNRPGTPPPESPGPALRAASKAASDGAEVDEKAFVNGDALVAVPQCFR